MSGEQPQKPLWSPTTEQIENSNLTNYLNWLEREKSFHFSTYAELHEWSVTDVALFWETIWEYFEIIHSKNYSSVLDSYKMFKANWFGGSRLNFAENLLKYKDKRPAIIHYREQSEPERFSFAELHEQVRLAANGLKKLGVQKGDRVAAYIPNIPSAVIAMLATTSIGAIWSSCSPDFGSQGVLDRFHQIRPKVLITTDGYSYNGKEFDLLEKAQKLAAEIPEIETIVVDNILGRNIQKNKSLISWSDLLSESSEPLIFEQLPFDHPVYIMYSSGTTGIPKCIVHGAGGTLLQHLKEHCFHCDLTRDDLLFYFTTTGWMMWNWLVGSLANGNAILLYDGSPGYPDLNRLFDIVDKENISAFGTSPKFLSACQNENVNPKRTHNLTSLKSILSTGAPLTERNFEFVYNAIKSDLRLSSISGGTDILSCFMLGNPILPVYSSEIQSIGLGMAVETYDDNGQPIKNQVGELVCTKPFPSQPISFWNDPDDKKYFNAYFDHFENIWRHGDYIKIQPNGGVIVFGRSDSTLNPGGVRIGTAEIYGPVEELNEIIDSIVVGYSRDSEVEIILFVVLSPDIELNETLKSKIRQSIIKKASPRHNPKTIIAVNEIPRTISGKKVEIAVTRLINGRDVPNRDALANPSALDEIAVAWRMNNPC